MSQQRIRIRGKSSVRKFMEEASGQPLLYGFVSLTSLASSWFFTGQLAFILGSFSFVLALYTGYLLAQLYIKTIKEEMDATFDLEDMEDIINSNPKHDINDSEIEKATTRQKQAKWLRIAISVTTILGSVGLLQQSVTIGAMKTEDYQNVQEQIKIAQDEYDLNVKTRNLGERRLTKERLDDLYSQRDRIVAAGAGADNAMYQTIAEFLTQIVGYFIPGATVSLVFIAIIRNAFIGFLIDYAILFLVRTQERKRRNVGRPLLTTLRFETVEGRNNRVDASKKVATLNYVVPNNSKKSKINNRDAVLELDEKGFEVADMANMLDIKESRIYQILREEGRPRGRTAGGRKIGFQAD